jgi:lipopolysaccharide export system protein LptC
MRALRREDGLVQVARAAPAPRAPRRGVRLRLGSDRYSRRVALLKRALPAIGAALLLMVAAWPRLTPLFDSVRHSFAAIDLREARELKMIDPRYAGVDRLNRPYVVTAAVGRQTPSRGDLLSLERPRAVMIAHGGAKVELTAATGVYQSQAQLLDLFDDVTLTHQNGTRFVTERAHADFADNTAEGHDPIAGHGPSGDIWGQGFRVVDKGDTIIFTGRSHLILKGTKPAKQRASPPALPAAVMQAAAEVEAAAAASAPAAPSSAPAAPSSAPAAPSSAPAAPSSAPAAANAAVVAQPRHRPVADHRAPATRPHPITLRAAARPAKKASHTVRRAGGDAG